jgi:hypothetical protein
MIQSSVSLVERLIWKRKKRNALLSFIADCRPLQKRTKKKHGTSNTVFSPQGRLHQVEYALEAVKQGSASVGLRNKTHVLLLALKVQSDSLLLHTCGPDSNE